MTKKEKDLKQNIITYCLLFIFCESLYSQEYIIIDKFIKNINESQKIRLTDKIFVHYDRIKHEIPSATVQDWLTLQEAFLLLYSIDQNEIISKELKWELKYIQAYGFRTIKLYDIAIPILEKLIIESKNGTRISALVDLSDTYELTGDFQNSCIAMSKVIDSGNNSVMYLSNYGLKLLKAQKYKESIEILNSIEETKDLVHTILFKARAYAYSKDFINAKKYIDKACAFKDPTACTMKNQLSNNETIESYWNSDKAESEKRWAPKNLNYSSIIDTHGKDVSKYSVDNWFSEIFPETIKDRNFNIYWFQINDIPFPAITSKSKDTIEKYVASQHLPSAIGLNINLKPGILISKLNSGSFIGFPYHLEWQKILLQKHIGKNLTFIE